MCSIMGFTKAVPEDRFREYFDRTKSRGPDMTRIEPAGDGMLCFHRLAHNLLDFSIRDIHLHFYRSLMMLRF